MSCTSRLTQLLHERGFRVTPQRLAILQALHESGHLSPVQVYQRTRDAMPGMTEATVYRTLEFLCDNDIVYATQNGGGHLTYELAGISHHHLVCRSCGAQVDLEPTSFQEAIAHLETQTNYRIDAGHLMFFGLCPECKQTSNKEG
jgi:Fur family ferric uptake transcriptional regulator